MTYHAYLGTSKFCGYNILIRNPPILVLTPSQCVIIAINLPYPLVN